MNWYKKAQASFQTFGIEDKITKSFINAYQIFIQYNKNKNLEASFQKQKSMHIGTLYVTDIMQPIIEHYGQPKTPLPHYIEFFVMSRKHPSASKHTGAFFMIWKGDFVIGKILDQITEFKNIEEFTYSIQHELQHFLKSIYEGKESPEYAKTPRKERNKEDYFGDPWEIQGYSHVTAKKAIDDIKELYSFRIENTKPENIPHIKAKIAHSKNALISKFLLTEIKEFFEKAGAKLDAEIRKLYYMSTIKNFNRLFDQFVSEL